MQRVLFVNAQHMDFESNGERIKGTSLKYLEKTEKGGVKGIYPGKEWLKPECKELIAKASQLVPGQLVDLDFSIEGRRVVLSDIIPGELAVDFDSIL